MNFLLKIVEGPNKGAEIALVSGVAVTLGKGDDCDIVLADPTLPPEPISLEASDAGVTADGEPLEPFAVRTSGATSFAVGPADAPWGELKWPAKGESKKPEAESRGVDGGGGREAADAGREKEDAPRDSAPAADGGAAPAEGRKKRGGCCGCLVALALLVVALACLAWFFREKIAGSCRDGGGLSRFASALDRPEAPKPAEKPTLAAIAKRYGLSVKEGDGPARLAGNLKTRADRLRATAEAYEARPGVELDLSDDESFRAAADAALFTLTEGALRVVSATNRFLSIAGVSRSPTSLGRTLKALNADLPRLRDVDASAVRFGHVPRHDAADGGRDAPQGAELQVLRPAAKKSTSPSLPVCGILTKPYPCLVMRDGTRVLEGAPLGENVILKISADEVTVTNSAGRFVWKP